MFSKRAIAASMSQPAGTKKQAGTFLDPETITFARPNEVLLRGRFDGATLRQISQLRLTAQFLPSSSDATPTTYIFMQVDPWDPSPIVSITEETHATGIEKVPWDRLQLSVDPQAAVEYASNVASWDAEKRRYAREMLRDFRQHFHLDRPG